MFALAGKRFAFEGISVFRSAMLLLTARALANSGFAFERIAVFSKHDASAYCVDAGELQVRVRADYHLRCGIATGGFSVFRSGMLPLIARRRRDCLKLVLSAVCCK